ncbi:MAG TPA: heavy metal-associated domain-containing protein [Cyclobacteriaceae bacterium]|nr:heavy metal-associated domain-containing protein [Cyclobacteriaceae bacterium]
MKTLRFQLEVLTCPSCINKIEGVLKKEDGVEDAKVLFNSSKVKVEYNEEKTSADKLAALIEQLGYPVLSQKAA